MKDEIKKFQKSSEKNEIALLYQIVKSQEQVKKENRDLTYSNIVLGYVASIVSLMALGLSSFHVSGYVLYLYSIVTVLLLFGGMCWIYYEYSGYPIYQWGSLAFMGLLIIVGVLLLFLACGGNIGGQYWTTQPDNLQILINCSCTGETNCSIISQKEFPSQIQCPNIISSPPKFQQLKCPPMLSLPKM